MVANPLSCVTAAVPPCPVTLLQILPRMLEFKVNFNEADLITCLANDYGYEYWMAKSIELYGDDCDQVILISSSGKSPNVVNAAKTAKDKGYKVITFTGFDEDNPLNFNGELNFWVNSRAYNVVEMIHHIWLLAVCDAIIGKAEYPAC